MVQPHGGAARFRALGSSVTPLTSASDEGHDLRIAHRSGAGGELGREGGRVGAPTIGNRGLEDRSKGGRDGVDRLSALALMCPPLGFPAGPPIFFDRGGGEFSSRIQQTTAICGTAIRVTLAQVRVFRLRNAR